MRRVRVKVRSGWDRGEVVAAESTYRAQCIHPMARLLSQPGIETTPESRRPTRGGRDKMYVSTGKVGLLAVVLCAG